MALDLYVALPPEPRIPNGNRGKIQSKLDCRILGNKSETCEGGEELK
jgi:hypothetical protein